MEVPYLRLLGAQIAIGAAAIFARYALTGAGPLAVAALRLDIAAALAVAFALAGRFSPLGARRELAFAAAGVALAVHFAAWIASLSYTSVAVSTLLVTTTPLWTELYDLARARRAPQRSFVLALLLGLGGGSAVAGADSHSSPPVPGHGVEGAAFALLGAVAIGAYLVIVRAASAAGPHGVPTRYVVGRTYAWAALALTVAALASHERAPAATDLGAWGGILAMALVSQSVGHTLLNEALRFFSPSTIAFSTLLEPAIAALLAAAMFRETLSIQMCFGALLVLAAVATTLKASAYTGISTPNSTT